jgi:Flp pilus assembly protein TadD
MAAAVAIYDQAVLLFREGRLPEARVRLEQLTQQEGANAESWNLLGAVCGQSGDWPAAVAAFEQAIRLAPDNRYYAENLQAAREQRRE